MDCSPSRLALRCRRCPPPATHSHTLATPTPVPSTALSWSHQRRSPRQCTLSQRRRNLWPLYHYPTIATPAVATPAPVAKTPSIDLTALLLDVVSEETGYPVEMLGMEMTLEADLGIDSIKRVEILSAMREREPGLPEVDTAEMAALNTLGQIVDSMEAHAPAATIAAPVVAAPVVAAPSIDLTALLLDVVSEKTGYPVEMLGMEMTLEADLGIDSIKRVEILSAMREREPGLPEVDTAEMAALNTLGQIVDSMQAHAPAATTAAPVVAAPSIDLTALLLDVVSEKTGYPVDMLGMEMTLEADLGIDSIKRVEILSAMREREPGLPEVDTAEMAALNTLGQIVDSMQAHAPAATTAAPVVAAPSIDLTALLLDVVSEKTGYPVDMLGMEMTLESDLGIDSIKRVEILSAMRERACSLPEVDTAEMAALNTLGQIVDSMQAHAPAATTAPIVAAPSIDLTALLLDVVSEDRLSSICSAWR